jgi:hypothetical protein
LHSKGIEVATALEPEKLPQTLRIVAAWRADPQAVVPCPNCDADGLVITDCSARPYTEWYRLQCGACGLEHMLSIPYGTSGFGAF